MKVRDDETGELVIDTETCLYCTGMSAVRKTDGSLMTSREWCESVTTCAATIDWEKMQS